jgi:Carbohydrate esterase, sialic acid-specific acetylesterase
MLKKITLFPVILLCIFLQKANGQPEVSKKKFHLYLLVGQSNMAGRGVIEKEDTTKHLRIWTLTKDNQWVKATEPLHFDKPTMVGVGPGFAFAKAMAEADTNVVIGLIPCAVGGSPISVWEATKYYEPTKTYPFDEAIRRTIFAQQSGTLKGILWQQGESDSDSIKAKIYGTALEKLVKNFRKALKIKKLPFVAGTIAPFYISTHLYAKEVNEAIEALPRKVKHTAFVSAEDLTHKGDGVHLDSASARRLGKRYAKVFQKLN